MIEELKFSRRYDMMLVTLPKQDQRSQKLTPREPKGNKIRGFKVKTSTQKLKSQYVISAKQSKTSEPMSQECLKKISKKYVIKKWRYPHICLISVRK